MIFQIKIADQIIEIHSIYDKVYTWCEKYVVFPFEKEKKSIQIIVKRDDIEGEDQKVQYSCWKKNPHRIMVYHPAHLETMVGNRKISEIMPFYSTFLIHGSLISYNGHGYLFTAPSGTGKTTRANLWIDEYPSAFIVNGDKPLIRVGQSEVIAYGTPWCGKENVNINTSVPLRAILFVERVEEGEIDSIYEMQLTEAFPELYKQSYHPANDEALRRTIQLIRNIEGKVKFYRFRSSPTVEAIRLAYETIQNSDIESNS